jgi:hypothetical protein
VSDESSYGMVVHQTPVGRAPQGATIVLYIAGSS